jgi:glycosyltransferase involved in cell wall biosynthesis
MEKSFNKKNKYREKMEKLVSVIVCTYNRAKYLEKCLESLHQQTYKNYEITIVNGPSTDETSKVIEKFPHLKIIHQEQLDGLSNARNLGIKAAKGDIIGFIDDDAITNPDWIERIINTFETIKPQPICIGGKIEPIWEISRPEWLEENQISCLTVLDISKTPLVLKDNYLFGTNMAFEKNILKSLGGFSENLGRKGDTLLSNEEGLIQDIIRNSGYHCFYHPEILVRHHIPKERLTKKWILKRYYWQGISDALMHDILDASHASWSKMKNIIRFMKRMLCLVIMDIILIFKKKNKKRSGFHYLCLLTEYIGYFVGLIKAFKIE